MNLDAWQEVFEVLRRNKLRTFLTALSVAWGIFILVVLIAAGNGLRSGVEWEFRDDATNSLWIRRGKTSVPYQGHAPGRPVNLDNSDLEALEREVPGIEHMSARYYVWGGTQVSRGSRTAAFDLRGCHPDHQYLERTLMIAGRFLNDLDVSERRKVAVIGPAVKATLFGSVDPIGEMINVRGVNYQVIGVFEDQGGEGELRRIYVPISTAQLVYHGGTNVHQILLTTGAASLEQTEEMARRSREVLAARHHFDPDDRRALPIANNLVQFKKLMDVFDWVRTFVWVVGLGTLFAGIVGVSNIMIISVQERTLEIGIRKAIGATPPSIISMILKEAVLLTSLAGYLGLVSGLGLVEILRRHLPENDYIRNPTVDVRVALVATLVLIVSGALAGFLPALAAARVRPVVAMRDVTA
ncbi:MAG TPA: ABC transporter permease [Polyangiaceae bacterium]|nr:ABC transporter permease [Polyangiaceae bacterium]